MHMTEKPGRQSPNKKKHKANPCNLGIRCPDVYSQGK